VEWLEDEDEREKLDERSWWNGWKTKERSLTREVGGMAGRQKRESLTREVDGIDRRRKRELDLRMPAILRLLL